MNLTSFKKLILFGILPVAFLLSSFSIFPHSVDAAYEYVSQWGSFGTGNSQFNYPYGITVDSSGNIYVADTSNHRIQKFDSSGNFITKWGTFGPGDGQFSYPFTLVSNDSNNIYIVDAANNRVQEFDSSGNFITKWGTPGSGDGQFDGPIGITIDSVENVYVIDSGNSRIQKFDSSGNFITKWGTFGSGDGQLHWAGGITINSSDDIYAIDTYNHRVEKFSLVPGISFSSLTLPEGTDDTLDIVLDTEPSSDVAITLSTTTPSSGSGISLSTTTLLFTASDWDTPQSITVTALDDNVGTGDRSATINADSTSDDDAYDNLTSSSPITITEDDPSVTTDPASNIGTSTVTLNGTLDLNGGANATDRGFIYGTTTSYGATTTESGDFGDESYSLDITSLTPDTTYHFEAFAVTPGGTFYGNDLTFITHATTSYQASDVLGQTDGTGTTTFDTSYVNDDRNHTNQTGFNYPYGLALDEEGHRLFISDCSNNRVLGYDLDSQNNLIHHYADHVLGQLDFVSNSSDLTQGGMSCPSGLAFDSTTNKLFVSDTSHLRVLVFDLSGGITNGMNATYVLGQPDFDTSNQEASQNGMSSPFGLAYNPSTKLLSVSDYSNHRVLIFDLSSGIQNGMDASYILGQPDFDSNTYTTTQSGMNRPYAITLDQTHNRLFVDDDNNSRVLVFDLSGGIQNGMDASYVLGQPDFDTNDYYSPPTDKSIGCAEALTYDEETDTLFVGDECSNRILTFDLSSGITNYMEATSVIGQVDFASDDWSCEPSSTTLCDVEIGMAFDPTNGNLYLTDSSNNRALFFHFIRLLTTVNGNPIVGTPYSDTLGTQGSQGTVTFAISTGSLPPGLSLNSTTGEISGTPTTAGAYTFEIMATDRLNTYQTFHDLAEYTLTVTTAPVILSHHHGGGGSSSPIIVSTPPSTDTTGCQPGDLFSRTTGARCSTPPPQPGDCLPGYSFSPTTGLPCSSTTTTTTTTTVTSPSPFLSLLFSRNLTLGSVGEDVRQLQMYLNSHGFLVNSNPQGAGSPGHESTYFGLLTKTALSKFQASHSIYPSVGYFGPITRGVVNGR